MMKLDNFVGMMTGHFDNKDQFKKNAGRGENISICGTCKYNL